MHAFDLIWIMMSFAHVATPCSVTGFTQTLQKHQNVCIMYRLNEEFSNLHIVKGRMKWHTSVEDFLVEVVSETEELSGGSLDGDGLSGV